MGGARVQPGDADVAMLVALADGSLPPQRRAEAERALRASPEIGHLLEKQARAVALLRALDLTAPPGLRSRVEAERRRGVRRIRRRQTAWGGGLAGALAVGVLLVALLLPLGTPAAPTVVQAAALAYRGPTGPSPAPGKPNLLRGSFAGLALPDYRAPFRWAASGMRNDDIQGRKTRTVYYSRDGRRIAYTVVSGPPLSPPPRGRPASQDGTRLVAFRSGPAYAVSWSRGGHTCVLSGAGVPPAELLELAAWRGQGALRF